MNDDNFNEVFTLDKHEVFYFREDTKEGEKEVRYQLTSKDNPKLMVVINEKNTNDTNYLVRQLPKNQSSSNDFIILTHLEGSGEETRSFVAEKRWVYLTFINYSGEEGRIDLTISSKTPTKFLHS